MIIMIIIIGSPLARRAGPARRHRIFRKPVTEFLGARAKGQGERERGGGESGREVA